MDTPEQTQDSRDKLMTDLKLVMKDAEELLKNTGQQMDSGYQAARARFEATLQNAKIDLGEFQERAMATTKDSLEKTERYVQENPWQAVGVGAIAGLVIGLLLGRK